MSNIGATDDVLVGLQGQKFVVETNRYNLRLSYIELHYPATSVGQVN
jgi:hypothetical protein